MRMCFGSLDILKIPEPTRLCKPGGPRSSDFVVAGLRNSCLLLSSRITGSRIFRGASQCATQQKLIFQDFRRADEALIVDVNLFFNVFKMSLFRRQRLTLILLFNRRERRYGLMESASRTDHVARLINCVRRRWGGSRGRGLSSVKRCQAPRRNCLKDFGWVAFS